MNTKRKSQALLFLDGLFGFSPAMDVTLRRKFTVSTDYPKVEVPSLSVEDALRSDWEKIGGDFWNVIHREQEKSVRNPSTH